MSQAVISSNLDNDTLSKTLKRKQFTDYSERYIPDGLYDYPNEEESVDLDISIHRDDDILSESFSSDEDNDEQLEVAYKSKMVRRITQTREENEEEVNKDNVKTIKKMKKAKKGFTVEDQIARNFQDLLKLQKEYVRDSKGDFVRSKRTWFKISGTTFSLAFSLVNSLIGAGILSLANTCYKMGIIGFVCWFILTFIFFCYYIFYFNRAIYLTGSATLGEILSLVLGNIFASIVDLCNTLFFFCVLLCYQVIAVQYILGIAQDLTDRDTFDFTMAECYGDPVRSAGISCGWHYIVLAIVILCFNLPLVLPKSVKFLNRISTLTVIAATVTALTIFGKAIYSAINGSSSNGTDGNYPTFKGKLWPQSAMSFFTMAPFVTSNFQIHSCLAPLYSGTKGISKKNKVLSLHGASYLAMTICTTLILIVAISGNVSFDSVSSNVLNDFSNTESSDIDWLIIICRVLMIVVVVISYPALMFPVCASLLRYIPKKLKFMQLWNGRVGILIVRLTVLSASSLLAAFITDIGVIFTLASAIFSIFVVYIGPLSIMMLWPRFEKLGDPNFQKLKGNQTFSMDDVERAIGNQQNEKDKTIQGVMETLQKGEFGSEMVELHEEPLTTQVDIVERIDEHSQIQDVALNDLSQTEAEKHHADVDIPVEFTADYKDVHEQEMEMEQQRNVDVPIELTTDYNNVNPNVEKEHHSDVDIPVELTTDYKEVNEHKESDITTIQVPKEIEKLAKQNITSTEVNYADLRKHKIVKLPNAHIPWYRYVLYSIAMIICVIYCLLAVVGTLLGY
ncbi:N-system amino acid transporter 1 [Entamoeba marina]